MFGDVLFRQYFLNKFLGEERWSEGCCVVDLSVLKINVTKTKELSILDF